MSEHHKLLVVKSNALVEAMSDMGLQEMRFLAFAASQLPHDLVPEKGQPYDMEIDVQSFAATFEITEKNAYRELKKLADRLIQKIVEFDDDEGYEVAVGLLSKRKYHHGEGRLWFRFDEDLLPHLIGLTERFTQYRIKDVYQFSRASTFRLYELLKEFKNLGKREIAIDDLRWKLGLTDKYPRVTSLKDWVIEPAVKEINATSDIKVQYEQRKRGRRVVSLIFHMIDNDDTKTHSEKIRELFEKELDQGEDLAPEIAKLLREEYRMNAKQARQIANGYSQRKSEIIKKLPILKKRWEKLPAKNPRTGRPRTSLGGYIFSALKSDMLQGSLI